MTQIACFQCQKKRRKEEGKEERIKSKEININAK